MLVRLTDGHPASSKVSHRHRVWLDIEKLWHEDHVMIGEGAETHKQYHDRIVAKAKQTGDKIAKKPRREGKPKTV
jgi:hypothetical protein